jgi:3-oxoacyl-[acyl-carrier protein] reductase
MMSDRTTSRVALVLGATGGIGRAIVDRLVRDGLAVGVHYAGNAGRADEAVAAVSAETWPTKHR